MTKDNAEAWAIFCDLDTFGRDLDTMSGLPLNLRLEPILRACEGSSNPAGMEWRVKEIDRIVTKYRRDEAKKRQER